MYSTSSLKINNNVLKSSYISIETRRKTLKRDDSTCVFCESKGISSLCHLIPRCRGGNDSINNLAVCCKSCYRKKRYQMPLEFFFDGFFGDSEFEIKKEVMKFNDRTIMEGLGKLFIKGQEEFIEGEIKVLESGWVNINDKSYPREDTHIEWEKR